MSALYLTEEDVRELLDMPAAIEAVEESFRHLADDTARNVPRARATAPGIILHSMCASAEYLGLVGWKNYTTRRDGARFHTAVYEIETGEMAALIEADYLGQLRTGAASGVATEFMARTDATAVGLFGSGKQARTQLEAVCHVRKVDRVEVYSPDETHRTDFADEMSERCDTEVVPVPVPNKALADKDILICATSSKTPLFEGRNLEEGMHLNVIGSNFPAKAEIDVDAVRQADVIVCDSIAQCRQEAGDLLPAVEAGVTDWRLMHELGDVVAGTETGRARPENVTLFKSVGLAVEDVAVAGKLLEQARAAGRGQPLPF